MLTVCSVCTEAVPRHRPVLSRERPGGRRRGRGTSATAGRLRPAEGLEAAAGPCGSAVVQHRWLRPAWGDPIAPWPGAVGDLGGKAAPGHPGPAPTMVGGRPSFHLGGPARAGSTGKSRPANLKHPQASWAGSGPGSGLRSPAADGVEPG
jgi:hypothetical protein